MNIKHPSTLAVQAPDRPGPFANLAIDKAWNPCYSDYMASILTSAERETHLNMTGDDHSVWIVTTDDPYWKNRLASRGYSPTATRGELTTFAIPARLVSIRKNLPARKVSDEARNAFAQRVRAKKGKVDEE